MSVLSDSAEYVKNDRSISACACGSGNEDVPSNGTQHFGHPTTMLSKLYSQVASSTMLGYDFSVKSHKVSAPATIRLPCLVATDQVRDPSIFVLTGVQLRHISRLRSRRALSTGPGCLCGTTATLVCMTLLLPRCLISGFGQKSAVEHRDAWPDVEEVEIISSQCD